MLRTTPQIFHSTLTLPFVASVISPLNAFWLLAKRSFMIKAGLLRLQWIYLHWGKGLMILNGFFTEVF
jgi:hypothetical protein